VRQIQAELERARKGEQFEIIAKWAVRTNDLHGALLDYEPQIVHFSRHGAGDEGLAFEDETGQVKFVDAEALTGLFELFAEQVECVVLNACYSEEQAEAIAQHINYVIGIKKAIGDQAAIEFAAGFYNALGAGRPVEFAHKFGCAAIRLAGIPEQLIPILKKKPNIGETVAEIIWPEGQPPTKEESMSAPSTEPIEVFFSYAHKDEHLRDQLANHLSILKWQHIITEWYDREISAGTEWAGKIDAHLNTARIILLLISSDFLASDYCYSIEVTRAMERHAAGEACVIPVILRPVVWQGAPFEKLQALPKNAIPVISWSDIDEAFTNVAEGIRKVVEEISPAPDPFPDPQRIEPPDGPVPLDSTVYIERPPIEADCYERILKPGALIRIKAPRQMGKSSLMGRILHHASQQDYQAVSLNFQLADRRIFTDLKVFLQWFCAKVSQKLGLTSKLEEYWDHIYGDKDNCTVYFEEYLLQKISNPLALALDEVNLIFQHPEIATDFFGLLRAWHEEANKGNLWKKLRLLIVHSQEVYIPLNIHQSPFNVGLQIELQEFSQDQVQELVKRHGLGWNTGQIEQLRAMVGGHPYLVRAALYHIARHDTSLEQLLQTAATEAGLYSDHLQRHLWHLEQNPRLAEAMKQVIATTSPVRLAAEETFKLDSMGLVSRQGNDVKPLCNLYRQYFRDRLGVS